MMDRTILLVMFSLVFVSAIIWVAIDPVNAGTSETITQSVGYARCFNDIELRESIATLKQQGGADVAKVSESPLTKARTADACRIQVVQALISSMGQATNPTRNQYENFFLWLHGASLLADLQATEALDLLMQISTSPMAGQPRLVKVTFPRWWLFSG